MLNISSEIKTRPNDKLNNPDCFKSVSQYEISNEKGKLIGSAQKVNKNSFLQHGSFYYTNSNLNIENYISGSISESKTSFSKSINYNYNDIHKAFYDSFYTYFTLISYSLKESDLIAIKKLSNEKYTNDSWTFSR